MSPDLALPLFGCLVAASVTDLRSRLISNGLVAVTLVAGMILLATLHSPELLPGVIAMSVAMLLLGTLALVRPEGMGMGDAKLAAVISLYMGPSAAPALMIGFAVAALAGISLALARRRSIASVTVPLAPFLAIGVLPLMLPFF